MNTAGLIIGFSFLVLSHSSGEPQNKADRAKYVIAPSENTLVTVASQPECPLLIENAQALLNLDSSWAFRFSYELQNRGEKPIRNFTIYFWTSEGRGGTLVASRLKFGVLAVGEKITQSPTTEQGIVLPLTAELRKRLKLGLPMKMVVILMVEKIEFSDGSTFSAETTLNALKKYFEDRN